MTEGEEGDPTGDHLTGFHQPALQSKRVRLRTVTPSDYPYLYQLALSPEVRFRWRYRNNQPTFEEFARTFGNGVFAQFLVCRTSDSSPAGLIVCYQASRTNGFAYIALLGDPAAQQQGYLIEAAQLFIDYLFTFYGFRKLYAETPEFTMEYGSVGEFHGFVEEGRLRNHEVFLGREWDLCILALYRDSWQARHEETKERIAASRECIHSDDPSGPTIDEFTGFVAGAMSLQRSQLRPDSRFAADLGFDSIQFFELLCAVEELGALIPESAVTRIQTLEDLHFHVLQHRVSAVSGGSAMLEA